MSLISTLRKPEYDGLSDAECVSHLAETVEISRDASLYSIRKVRHVVPDLDNLRLVLGTIDAAAAQDPVIKGFAGTLQSVGIDFSDALTQQMIASLATAGSWPDAVTKAVREIGIVTGPRWKKEGLESAPDEQAVAAARARIVELDKMTALEDTIRSMRLADNTLAQVKTAVEAAIGGW